MRPLDDSNEPQSTSGEFSALTQQTEYETKSSSVPPSISELIFPRNGGEIFFGIVSPVGTDEQSIVDQLLMQLKSRDYHVEEIKISALIEAFSKTVPSSQSEFERIRQLQDAGNLLREDHGHDILAELACAEVARRRAEGEPPGWEAIPKRIAFIFRSLKHPEEASLLRTIYGHGFFLVAIHSTFDGRVANLMRRGMSEHEAKSLMEHDDKESADHGQNTRETFELADFYIRDRGEIGGKIHRFVDLLFGHLYITPSRDEYGMHLATCAAQRSGDLSRQVGAAIVDDRGDVIAVGCNEVPKAGGGSYWPDHVPDVRDFALGRDPNDAEKARRFTRLKDALGELKVTVTEEQLARAWSDSGLRDITEFGRTVHAEMDAILSATRRGVSIADATLYATTFPCHNCARHIVASGIMRLVYIEPYAKSEAYALYGDSIVCEAIPAPTSDREKNEEQVTFDPFEGIAPRRFSDLFGMRYITGRRIERKSRSGKILEQNLKHLKTPRLQLSEFSYLKREEFAIKTLSVTILKGVQSNGHV